MALTSDSEEAVAFHLDGHVYLVWKSGTLEVEGPRRTLLVGRGLDSDYKTGVSPLR